MKASLKFGDSKYAKTLFEFLHEVHDQPVFEISPKGLSLLWMDNSRIAMIDLELPAEGFAEFNCVETLAFSMDIEAMLQRLKKVYDGESLSLTIDTEGDKYSDYGYVSGELFGPVIRRFKHKLYDNEIDEEHRRRPKVKHTFFAKCSLKKLNILLEDYFDRLIITGTPEKLTFSCEPDSCGESLGGELINGLNCEVTQAPQETVKSIFTAEYLKEPIQKLEGIVTDCSIGLQTDFPICLSYDSPGKISLKFWVAPRIEIK